MPLKSRLPVPAAHHRFLIVDDDPVVLKALLHSFRHENYQIETATSGEMAIDRLRQKGFSVLISDYRMPQMDGLELLAKAREIQSDMVRILLTVQGDIAPVMGAIGAGLAFKLMIKPWQEEELRSLANLAIEHYEAGKAAHKATSVFSLSSLKVTNRSQLAVMLCKHDLLSMQQVRELNTLHEAKKEPPIKLILEKGWVGEKEIRDLLRRELQVEEIALSDFQVEPSVASLVPLNFCERQLVVPLRLEGKRLTIAVADPLDLGLIDDLRFYSGLNIHPVVAGMDAIRQKIDEIYRLDKVMDFSDLETLLSSIDPYEGIEIVIDEAEEQSIEELLISEEPPAIRIVNAIILEAIRVGASDVHIQPRSRNLVVRYRIDGVLMDKINIPQSLLQSIVSRIKIMAELDISERRRPQDGRITVRTPMRVIDLRISTLPTINGEKVVMRILDRNSRIHSLEGLRFSQPDLAKVLNFVDKPQGIILATGPTGSGKTTTLYALLQHNATPAKNYVTIEDPVEYYMDMAGQILIREKIGLTFPVVLRSILRQDPDVILLGEIRDIETAEVAFHAALTGHVVFSTLHTNTAVATLSRLFDLGMKPFVVAAALEGIIAQRLVRAVCPECKEEDEGAQALLPRLGPVFMGGEVKASKGRGCAHCHGTGYKGRLGIYEVLEPNEEMRHLIASGASILEISTVARKIGTFSLLEDALMKVNQGCTSVEEVLRVLGPQN
jgi:type II secretory ATPase GspE/PulE/Tfp pilus assembly ATPase PilB-like protein/DNA-binding response OmpR family regulator